MHATVGASCSCNFGLGSENGVKGFGEHFLNRQAVRLYLPAMVRSAFVRQVYEVSFFHAAKLRKKNQDLFIERELFRFICNEN